MSVGRGGERRSWVMFWKRDGDRKEIGYEVKYNLRKKFIRLPEHCYGLMESFFLGRCSLFSVAGAILMVPFLLNQLSFPLLGQDFQFNFQQQCHGINICKSLTNPSSLLPSPYHSTCCNDLVPPIRQCEPFINGSLPLINVPPIG